MARKSKIVGLEATLGNMNREIGAIKTRTIGGLMAGGLIVEAESNRNVPVEHGNLHGSSYTQKAPAGGLSVEVGYEATYAPFVHENLEQKLKGRPRPSGLGTFWNPGGPKFLENAATNKSDDVVAAVASRAKVPG